MTPAPHLQHLLRGLYAVAANPMLLASEQTVIRLAIAELEALYPAAHDDTAPSEWELK